jgi:hypothetical protein
VGQLQAEKQEKRAIQREKEDILKELRIVQEKCEFTKISYEH